MPKTKSEEKHILPLHDKVIVSPKDREETMTSAGIIIPDTVDKEKPMMGTVIAVGPGKFNEDGDERVPMSVSKGDTVLFSKYGYDEVKIDGKEYLILSESQILAVIN